MSSFTKALIGLRSIQILTFLTFPSESYCLTATNPIFIGVFSLLITITPSRNHSLICSTTFFFSSLLINDLLLILAFNNFSSSKSNVTIAFSMLAKSVIPIFAFSCISRCNNVRIFSYSFSSIS